MISDKEFNEIGDRLKKNVEFNAKYQMKEIIAWMIETRIDARILWSELKEIRESTKDKTE